MVGAAAKKDQGGPREQRSRGCRSQRREYERALCSSENMRMCNHIQGPETQDTPDRICLQGHDHSVCIA